MNSLLLSWQDVGVQFMALAAVLETQPLPTALLEKGLQRKLYLRDKQAFRSSIIHFPCGIYQPEFEEGPDCGDY